MKKNPFRLILASVRVNGHTSTDVVRLVKEKSPYSKVLVLGGESKEDLDIAIESMNEGAQSQVKKPYDKSKLEAEITNTIGKSPPFPIIVGGHFCVGKTKFSYALVNALNRPKDLAELFLHYKIRPPYIQMAE